MTTETQKEWHLWRVNLFKETERAMLERDGMAGEDRSPPDYAETQTQATPSLRKHTSQS